MTETSGREKVLEEAAQWHTVMARTLRESARRVREEWSETAYRDEEAREALADARRDVMKADWHEDCASAIRALASPSTQEPALPGGKVEEIARVTQEMLRAFTNKLMECGGTSIVSVLSDDVVRTCLAAALRTHAGESAAQSERAGLERAAKLHEAEARKTMLAHKILFHQNSAAAIRKLEPPANLADLSAARKAGGE